MKHFAMSLALACALSSTIIAGEIPSVGLTGDITTSGVTHPGDIPSVPGDVQAGGFAAGFSTAGMTILQTLFGVGL